ncbi:uncharacterized protein PV06_06410 [Exophiala oligosperma]|uniref:Uncharacterized protein n=1 Tax=Exophiala oligosperma TaxID=215243 RepID=A0A0D2DIT8_9EURO|nr:uncharacterized protein PV06_06410 [Exophiala oligosperma]KIW42908.1 hypothetical protein PV06_06410 [Exophiala oligosperma]
MASRLFTPIYLVDRDRLFEEMRKRPARVSDSSLAGYLNLRDTHELLETVETLLEEKRGFVVGGCKLSSTFRKEAQPYRLGAGDEEVSNQRPVPFPLPHSTPSFKLRHTLIDKLKAHQIEGVNFLWSKTASQSTEKSGTLHGDDKGLGKTVHRSSLSF